jgi:hypothetical protein
MNDEHWQEKAFIAIESFSRTWGGAGFIIIPTDGGTISPIFWEILLSYDADYFWIAYQTNDRFEYPIKFSTELVNELKLRLAPFHHDYRNFSETEKVEISYRIYCLDVGLIQILRLLILSQTW